MKNYSTNLTDNYWKSMKKLFDYKRKSENSLRLIVIALLLYY